MPAGSRGRGRARRGLLYALAQESAWSQRLCGWRRLRVGSRCSFRGKRRWQRRGEHRRGARGSDRGRTGLCPGRRRGWRSGRWRTAGRRLSNRRDCRSRCHRLCLALRVGYRHHVGGVVDNHLIVDVIVDDVCRWWCDLRWWTDPQRHRPIFRDRQHKRDNWWGRRRQVDEIDRRRW